jgi:REP element-mobilizing transposase RayT
MVTSPAWSTREPFTPAAESRYEMPQSLSQVFVHVVFGTKGRYPLLEPEVSAELYAYQATVLSGCGCQALAINGRADHVHLLCVLSRTTSIADMVEEVKKRSSKWLKTKGARYNDFAWQSGYGVFSVGPSQLEGIKRYVAGQEEHHRRRTFQEEYRGFLREHGVAYDERYVWD